MVVTLQRLEAPPLEAMRALVREGVPSGAVRAGAAGVVLRDGGREGGREGGRAPRFRPLAAGAVGAGSASSCALGAGSAASCALGAGACVALGAGSEPGCVVAAPPRLGPEGAGASSSRTSSGPRGSRDSAPEEVEEPGTKVEVEALGEVAEESATDTCVPLSLTVMDWAPTGLDGRDMLMISYVPLLMPPRMALVMVVAMVGLLAISWRRLAMCTVRTGGR